MAQCKDGTLTQEILASGTAIAHYTIDKPLGAGTTGVVYVAHDRDLDRTVALKFLAGYLAGDKQWRDRFQREARAMARINHPNIVTIYDIEEHDGRMFIAMEHVEGGSLDDYLTDRRLSVEESLELAIQISDGLAEAHHHGIVHRDIKPSNILVSNRGRAKIVDFGLAASLRHDPTSPANAIVGTVNYMSPEQVRSGPMDTRSDLFSLGVVLYRLFTGRPPFAGRTIAEIFEAILERDPIPMTEYAANVPIEVQRIVSKLLSKNLELRYPSADDVRTDLRFALEAVLTGRAQYAGRKKDFVRSIAVLPFANLSADKDQEYFCDGMAEEILNALTKVPGLRVAARTSTLPFKNSAEDAREVGRKLHVETLLEGSVRRAADRFRIAVQLIDVPTGYHLWSERYDQESHDIFAIQDKIAENVVRALQLILSEDERQTLFKAPTSDALAYDYYLRGRTYFHQGRRQSFQFARQMYLKAVEIDPKYALAHTGIAECAAFLVHYYGQTKDRYLTEADEASRKALEIDPGLGRAHAARGFTLWLLDRFDEAKKEFETAMRLDPDRSEAPYFYGRACFQRGEFAQAIKLFEQAARSRENHEAQYFAAQSYAALGDEASALAAYRKAQRAVERHVELYPDDARAYTMGAVALCRLGEKEAGLKWAEKAVAIDPADPGIQYNVACLFALEGEASKAIERLQAAVDAGFAHKHWVEKDPDLDSLRDDPRFKALKWRE
jgi:TolB-like protein/Tfp pilus assembly protein PilF/predicted Ser/Thr protein kinase